MGIHEIITWLYTHTPLVWYIQSYWRDEAFSVLLAQKPILQILALTARDYSPPLYYLILKLWMGVFGWSEISTRSLSLIFYVCSVFVMVEYQIHVLKRPARSSIIWGVGLGLLSPLMSYYAFESRGYALLSLCSVTSTYALMLGQKRLYMLAVVVGFFTHYMMAFLLVIHVVLVLRRLTPYTLKRYMLVTLVPGILMGIWIVWTIYQRYGVLSDGFWIPRPTWIDLIELPGILLTGHEVGFGYVYNLLPATIFFYLIVMVAFLKNTRPKAEEALLWCALGPGIITYCLSTWGQSSLFLPRYLIGSAPYILLIYILGIQRLRIPMKVIAVVILIGLMGSYLYLQIHYRLKEDLRSEVTAIKMRSQPGDYLIVNSELDYHTAQLYWHDADHVKIIDKTYTEIPSYVGKVLIPPSATITRSPCQTSCTAYLLTPSRQVQILMK